MALALPLKREDMGEIGALYHDEDEDDDMHNEIQ
jgi:hypothetical protein